MLDWTYGFDMYLVRLSRVPLAISYHTRTCVSKLKKLKILFVYDWLVILVKTQVFFELLDDLGVVYSRKAHLAFVFLDSIEIFGLNTWDRLALVPLGYLSVNFFLAFVKLAPELTSFLSYLHAVKLSKLPLNEDSVFVEKD